MTTKQIPVYIEDYSVKSFVVRGDTQPYRESLKALGGKWVNRLTDKSTGEKFGSWIFWTEKRREINNWVESGCNKVESSSGNNSCSSNLGLDFSSLAIRFTNMEEQLKRIEALVTELVTGEVVEEEQETLKRLLKR